VSDRRAHHPGLDGLRGAAVAAVLLFHGGFSWARGGYLGVSTFFTLSGFLITGLLVTEYAERGQIHLAGFWARRFRRLLPAQLAALLGVACFALWVADRDQLRQIRLDALATLAYGANWRFVQSGQSYLDLFRAPSPLLHEWSLAIEEQYYLVFPLIVAGVLAWTRGRRRALAVVLGALTLGSLGMALALRADITRVYYGTDTRVGELLLGGLLAIWATRPGVDLAGRRRPILAALGLGAAAATVVAWSTVDQTTAWLYRGGFAAYGVLSTIVVAAAVAPGPLRAVLAWTPLRALGLVSYGVYLYHWPIYLWLAPHRTGLGPAALFALRIGVTLVISIASYVWLEQPIRRGALRGRALAVALTSVALVAMVILGSTIPPPPPGRLAAEDANAATASTTSAFGGVIRQASATEPVRILILGDSVSWDAEPGLVAALRATGAATVTARNERGFGLTAPGFDWRTDWARVVREVRPELVVAFFGGWDEPFIAEHGADAYGRLLDEAIAILSADGARVLLLGQPVSVDRNREVRPRGSREAFRAAAARHAPATAFLDLDPALTPDGRFAFRLDGPHGPERVRKEDGTHICPAGSARIGRAVLDAVTPAWMLPAPPASWRAGDWALDRRYSDRPGACPE
jgi:peptidoglycan/LPS O-acetylase OafA/YrhL